MVRAKLKKWGGSLGVVIDAAEVRKRGLIEGMEIEFDPQPARLHASDIGAILEGISGANLRMMLDNLEKDEGWHD